MAIKSRLNVEVGFIETEIIESTETVTSEDRNFNVKNGAKEIIATIWGSNDDINWENVMNDTIAPNGIEDLIMGKNHYIHVKLTGKTTTSGQTSNVDGHFTYTPPE